MTSIDQYDGNEYMKTYHETMILFRVLSALSGRPAIGQRCFYGRVMGYLRFGDCLQPDHDNDLLSPRATPFFSFPKMENLGRADVWPFPWRCWFLWKGFMSVASDRIIVKLLI